MKKILALLLAPWLAISLPAQERLTDYVNPMVGTRSMGHTFPGACAPFGLVQLSPDTEMIPHNYDGVYNPEAYRYCAGYQWDDPTIIGFSHTHFNGTGHSDLGDILIMPATGPVLLDMGTARDPDSGYRSRFSHDTEYAQAGYYRVMLDDYGILAELTASERTGIHRYTYPGEKGHIVMDLDYGIYNYDGKVLMANLRVEDPYTLSGYRITRGWSRMNYTHFAVRFNKPIINYGCRNDEQVKYRGWWRKFNMEDNFPEMFGTKLKAFFEFDFTDGEPLEIKVSLSPVDALGAMNNLIAETDSKNFDDLREEVRDKWEKELSVIKIDTDPERKTIFYTALFRTMINPSIYQDVDGRYRGIDHNIHTAQPGRTNYTVFSVWDTFRAEHPLLNLLMPSRASQIVNSMLDHYRQSVHGALPVWSHMGNENWCMIGFHSVSVVADALVKGLDIDPELAIEACLASANVNYYDQTGPYREYGYVPDELSGVSASITLEYAYDDWAVASVGRWGPGDVTDTYLRSSFNYRNIFDPRLKFARPKNSAGEFREDFDLLDTHNQGFIEGNSWNYSFFVPHDVAGLVEIMGGERRFTERLDSLFTMELPEHYFEHTEDITEEGLIGNYVHGNEPSHHVPYLYAWTSKPWQGQYRLRDIMDRMYLNKPDGLCGNDDCGQMSAWYVFSVMGFYPVLPGSDQYVIGTPFARETTIRLENGTTFTVRAPKLSERNIYINSVRLNGKPYDKAYIVHSDIMEGGILEFEMASRPNIKRIFNDDQLPYSASTHEL